jgi:hypothetical protein
MLIQKCNTIVGHYRLSTHAVKKYAQTTQTAGKPFKVLFQDYPTRLRSNYDMLDRINQSKISEDVRNGRINRPTQRQLPGRLFHISFELLKTFKEEQDYAISLSNC